METNRKTPILLKYVPHGLDEKNFIPLDKDKPELVAFKKQLTGGKEYDFILLFNSRNIRRKSIPDTILAWKMFMDKLSEEQAKKCLLVLHTQPLDDNGTDLPAVIEYLFPKEPNIVISPGRLSPQDMNLLYNCSDGVILISSNEGWGLSLTEALLSGRMIIANVTGGMQDQMRFVDKEDKWFVPSEDIPSNHYGTYKEHGEWALPVYPSNLSLVGSIPTPYIFDTRCKPEDAADRMMELYNTPKEERQRKGLLGREWAIGDEACFTSEKMANKIIDSIDSLFDIWTPREKFELLEDTDFEIRTLKHKLLYE